MKSKYRGTGSGLCIFFIAIAILVTIFYQHRDDLGYKFNRHYYIHDSGIMEYSSSSLVSFPIKGDYSDLVGKDIYYYDDSNTLKKDKLVAISLADGKFTVSDGEHNTSKFLGIASSEILLVGSILDFFTQKTLYIFAILIPAILCACYVLYSFIMSFVDNKKKKK